MVTLEVCAHMLYPGTTDIARAQRIAFLEGVEFATLGDETEEKVMETPEVVEARKLARMATLEMAWYEAIAHFARKPTPAQWRSYTLEIFGSELPERPAGSPAGRTTITDHWITATIAYGGVPSEAQWFSWTEQTLLMEAGEAARMLGMQYLGAEFLVELRRALAPFAGGSKHHLTEVKDKRWLVDERILQPLMRLAKRVLP